MHPSLLIGKFSIGVGDRFARQAQAQLQACILAAEHGVDVLPVWNKSNREHLTVNSEPASVRSAADNAVRALRWKKPYFVDADHIRLETVDRFIVPSDFFTIDVADFIGQPAAAGAVQAFVRRHPELTRPIEIPGIDRPFALSQADLENITAKYLLAVQQAGRIYRHICEKKEAFVTEVSMDETDSPQTPAELLVILAAIADEQIPIQTIAPKFTGRFNKGVDYTGNVEQFEKEFNDDLAVLAAAVARYHLPSTLKLSVHSGSDKFSIYAPIRRAIRRFDSGLHLKTAGTTWLEELIGLAEGGPEGLSMAKDIYAQALEHLDELAAPYAAVIDIDPARLPSAAAVQLWTFEQFTSALRHDPKNKNFNPHLRQLLHVGYKIAAKKGRQYLDALALCQSSIATNVTDNLWMRHIQPVFIQ